MMTWVRCTIFILFFGQTFQFSSDGLVLLVQIKVISLLENGFGYVPVGCYTVRSICINFQLETKKVHEPEDMIQISLFKSSVFSSAE